MAEKTPHPTQKPEALLRKLILSSDKDGLIVDPFSGSGTTAVVSTRLSRNFRVNDSCEEYNVWASERLSKVQNKFIEEWIFLITSAN